MGTGARMHRETSHPSSEKVQGGGFRTTRNASRIGASTVLVVLVLITVALIPMLEQVDSESAGDYWTYTITSEGEVTGSGSAPSSPGKFTAPVKTGPYGRSTDGYSTGDWGFDSKGYGPFGSFYAAFDACHGNKILCHLDPDNLGQSVDGSQLSAYGDHTVNVMWVLPTIYWSVDSDGDLVLSNDPSKGKAYAHTIDGDVHEYLAIGVYEASTATVGSKTILTSTTDSRPTSTLTRTVFREYAGNNVVATEDGTNVTGNAMLWNLYAWQLYRFSVLAVSGGWNSQAVFGNGNVSGGAAQCNTTGGLDASGPYAGTVGNPGSSGNDTYHSSSVKAFIENAWGSLFDFVDGVLVLKNGDQLRMYATQSSQPKDVYSEAGYPTMVGVLPSNAKEGKYATTSTSSGTDPGFWGLPTGTDGSAGSGLCDCIWTDLNGAYNYHPALSTHVLYVGGYSDSDKNIAPRYGLSYMSVLGDVEFSSVSAGGRLTFVYDGDPTLSVQYDHSDLATLLEEHGCDPGCMSGLPEGMKIYGHDRYEKLDDIAAGFTHVGWIIDGKEYPATHVLVKKTDHVAKSVWIESPAVTYDHTRLVEVSGDPDSISGLSIGLTIRGHDGYEQLPSRDGCVHIGWLIEGTGVEVSPTAPFYAYQSHTVVSLWASVPTVIFDHSGLTGIVGFGAEGVSDLESNMTIKGNSCYPKLPDTAGYRHIGWLIEGTDGAIDPTAGLVSQDTHTARSVWKKIPQFIPIFPGEEETEWPIEVVVPDYSEPWLGKNGKSIILIAVVVAIIAELATLCISRKR